MRKEYAFSRGERGNFFRPDAELNLPVYLDPQVAEAVREHARKSNKTMGSFVNEVLRENLRPQRRRSPEKTR